MTEADRESRDPRETGTELRPGLRHTIIEAAKRDWLGRINHHSIPQASAASFGKR
jgi:hypothetical protein